jgi:hypothetical protein
MGYVEPGIQKLFDKIIERSNDLESIAASSNKRGRKLNHHLSKILNTRVRPFKCNVFYNRRNKRVTIKVGFSKELRELLG